MLKLQSTMISMSKWGIKGGWCDNKDYMNKSPTRWIFNMHVKRKEKNPSKN